MQSAVEQPTLRVSVIIPTYNRADYLRQALASVFAQSLEPWEVIVVDDGSNDSTTEVVNGFGTDVRHIRHDQNRGVSAARNSGLEAARGDVIAWLDADDLWDPSFLATVIPLLGADEGVHGAYTSFIHIDHTGNSLPQFGSRVVPPADLYAALAEDCFVLTSAFVARKSCYDRTDPFDPQFDICEDYDMFLRLAETCTIVGLSAALVKYRVHQQNTVSNVAEFCRSRLALTRKHFGEPVGDPQTWPTDKRRAHGHAFRAAALKCSEAGQPDEAWRYLRQAVTIWPSLLARLDTYYELACGDQPMGYRGHARSLNIEANGKRMLDWLDTLFTTVGPTLESERGRAYGTAHLALGMLADQSGDWAAARKHLLQVMWLHPDFLGDPLVIRRFVKLCFGKRVASGIRRLWPEAAGGAME